MHAEETQKKKIKGKHHRAPQPQGVPFSLVALMVVLALLCGCALGYMGGTRLSRTAKDLKQAQQRIEEYDLLLAQLSTDESENEILADLPSQEPAGDEGLAALSGEEMTTFAGEPQVVAQFDGGTILSDEAAQRYEAALADSAFSGEDVSNRTGEILTQVLHDMVGEKLAYLKAQEMGLLPYDEADQRAMDAQAQSEFDDTVKFYAEDASSEAALQAARQYLEQEEGITLETVRDDVEQDYWQTKLFNRVTENLDVSADDITALYNQLLTEQQAEFEADTDAFETALLGGETVVYYPAGYRTVKWISFELDETAAQRAEEIRAQLETETDEETRTTLQQELDGLYGALQSEAEDALGTISGGGDFDQVAASLGSDGATYYVSEKTTLWPPEVVQAAMALANPGDISQAVVTEDGVYIVRFIANVEAGAVPLSNVSTRLTTQTREQKAQQAYDDQVETWISEANVTYFPENMTEAN